MRGVVFLLARTAHCAARCQVDKGANVFAETAAHKGECWVEDDKCAKDDLVADVRLKGSPAPS